MYENTSILDSDKYVPDYFRDNHVCRFCWKLETSDYTFTKDIDLCLILKIQDCLDILLDINELIDKINSHSKLCFNCYSLIEKFYTFKQFCKRSDEKLKQILNNSPILVSSKENYETNDIKLETDITNDGNLESNDYFEASEDEKPLTELKVKKQKKYTQSCSECKIEFNSNLEQKTHNLEVHGKKTQSFECFGCKKRFKSHKLRLVHENTFCKELSKGYQCSTCNMLLPSRSTYKKHIKLHDNCLKVNESMNLTIPCRICKERFKNRELLLQHKETKHKKKKDYVCENSINLMEKKISNETRNQPSVSVQRVCKDPVLRIRYSYTCWLPTWDWESILGFMANCGRIFKRRDYLHKHKLIHTGTKQHVCTYCDFRTTQKSSLNVHIRKHTGERPFSCDLCPQKCISSSNLLAHRARHLGIKKFECSICGKKFGYKYSLEEHFSSTHGRSQNHVCNVCGAIYSRLRGLKRHIAVKHNEKVPEKSTEGADCNISSNVEINCNIRSNVEVKNISNNAKENVEDFGDKSDVYFVYTELKCNE